MSLNNTDFYWELVQMANLIVESPDLVYQSLELMSAALSFPS